MIPSEEAIEHGILAYLGTLPIRVTVVFGIVLPVTMAAMTLVSFVFLAVPCMSSIVIAVATARWMAIPAVPIVVVIFFSVPGSWISFAAAVAIVVVVPVATVQALGSSIATVVTAVFHAKTRVIGRSSVIHTCETTTQWKTIHQWQRQATSNSKRQKASENG